MDARQADQLRQIDPATLGQRIRAARAAAGLTQGQIAGGDVSIGYVSRIEAGTRRPDGKLLDALAARLATTVDELLSGIPQREADELRLLLDYAELSLESGEGVEAEARSAEVLERAAGSSLDDLRSRARFLHARALEAQGRVDEAILDLEDLTAGGDGGLPWVRASIALSRCYRESGDFTKAVEVGDIALRALSRDGLEASDEAVQMTVTVAAAHFERGDQAEAMRTCRRAIASADALGSPTARASAYWNASMVEAQRGSVERAIPLAEKALGLLGEGRDARNLARLRSQLGIMQLLLDPPELEAAEVNLHEAAAEFALSSAGPVDIARNELALARLQLLGGDPAGARDLSGRIHRDMTGLAPLLAADARVVEGQSAAAQGDPAEAAAAYRDAVLVLTGIGADRSAAQLWYELAGLLEEVGELEAARGAYRSAAAATGLRGRSMPVLRS